MSAFNEYLSTTSNVLLCSSALKKTLQPIQVTHKMLCKLIGHADKVETDICDLRRKRRGIGFFFFTAEMFHLITPTLDLSVGKRLSAHNEEL